MKDIPVFTTQNGVASLMLQQIPYTKRAYVTVHDSLGMDALLEECRDFCIAAGAEEIYACNHRGLDGYPVAAQMIWMQREKDKVEESITTLAPLSEDAVQEFREIYNRKMKNVPGAQWITSGFLKNWESFGKCYFVKRDAVTIGIGIVSGCEIRALASLIPGGGRDVVLALCAATEGDLIRLQVADVNQKAVRLYKALGFAEVGVENTWYKIY